MSINGIVFFFRQLAIPEPDVNLHVGSGSHTRQTADIMLRLEPVIIEKKPSWVVVYGDVNSTVAATLVCAKLGARVAHVEAGLRSFDRAMPEEINRLVTDQLADLLFTPSQDGNDNLAREGIAQERVTVLCCKSWILAGTFWKIADGQLQALLLMRFRIRFCPHYSGRSQLMSFSG